MTSDHERRLRRAFEQQAAHYDAPGLTTSQEHLLAWAVAKLPVSERGQVLDVAAGTGQLSCALAEKGARVLALDLTEPMLRQADRRRRERGLDNLFLCLGQAQLMPVADESVDLVTCRLAIHHIPEPKSVVCEMARACVPGGHVALIDLVSPDDPELGEAYNRLERLRDPSHVRAFRLDELVALLRTAGLTPCHAETRDVEVDVERWLNLTQPPQNDAEQIRRALRTELTGGAVTGMRPFEHDGRQKFRQAWAVVVAAKPETGSASGLGQVSG